MNTERLWILKQGRSEKGPVIYWMSRDQRVYDNWALIYAQECAIEHESPVIVVFCLAPSFLGATRRQYGFMLRGLQEVENTLALFGIPFYLLEGPPEKAITDFVNINGVKTLVADFDPLRIKREWRKKVAENVGIPFYEVDAHNIVPCRVASDKQEYGAYTIRPKIRRLLRDFMVDFPDLKTHPFPWLGNKRKTDWQGLRNRLDIDCLVDEVDWVTSGENAAHQTLKNFLAEGINNYNALRNDPTRNGVSHLSPYLHFGQISAQRILLELEGTIAGRSESGTAFAEELVVRRELSDNYCFRNPSYDSFAGLPNWAQKTLNEHRKDKRDYIYCLDDFEYGRTHDDLWNAAQMEMVRKGKMHGYMRMYWAKKILEWTESPEDAFRIAINLNDKYELDGRDPNGYTGIAWSIGGLHDRAWNERPVFGKIRYMSYNGCKSKFNVKEYIKQIKAIDYQV